MRRGQGAESIEVSEEEHRKGEGIPSPEQQVKAEEQAKRAQFNGLVKDSVSLQKLGKTVTGLSDHVQRLTRQFNSFDEQISSQMKSLGDIVGRKLEDLVAEGPIGKAEPGEGGPSATLEPPSKTLNLEQDCLHEKGALAVGASQKANPFGLPDQIPAIRLGYKADPKPLQRGRPRRQQKSPLPKRLPLKGRRTEVFPVSPALRR